MPGGPGPNIGMPGQLGPIPQPGLEFLFIYIFKSQNFKDYTFKLLNWAAKKFNNVYEWFCCFSLKVQTLACQVDLDQTWVGQDQTWVCLGNQDQYLSLGQGSHRWEGQGYGLRSGTQGWWASHAWWQTPGPWAQGQECLCQPPHRPGQCPDCPLGSWCVNMSLKEKIWVHLFWH